MRDPKNVTSTRTTRARLGPALLLAIALPVLGCGGGGAGGPKNVDLMTMNVYWGAEFDGLMAAILVGEPEAILAEVTQVWADVRATDFSVRAQAIADLVGAALPELIGLQEAAVWRSQSPADSIGPDPTSATTVEFDYAQMILDALAQRGLDYEIVVSVETFDAEMPAMTDDGLGLQDIRLTDRDVLLARVDREERGIQLANAQSGVYQAAVPLPAGLSLTNGWVSVDVTAGRRTVRVVSTHLASDVEEVQRAQAAEVLAGPVAGAEEVILMGDFNSDALGNPGPDDTQTYADLVTAGLEDAWLVAHPGSPGQTWGGRAPGLTDPDPTLVERIDHVFFAGDLKVRDMRRAGESPLDRRGGLWPSDHAGLTVTFGLR